MTAEKNHKYPLDATVIAQAQACNKGQRCLETGPKCRVGAILNEKKLVVDCLDKDASCPFYQANKSHSGSTGHGLCHCPVRLALCVKYDL